MTRPIAFFLLHCQGPLIYTYMTNWWTDPLSPTPLTHYTYGLQQPGWILCQKLVIFCLSLSHFCDLFWNVIMITNFCFIWQFSGQSINLAPVSHKKKFWGPPGAPKRQQEPKTCLKLCWIWQIRADSGWLQSFRLSCVERVLMLAFNINFIVSFFRFKRQDCQVASWCRVISLCFSRPCKWELLGLACFLLTVSLTVFLMQEIVFCFCLPEKSPGGTGISVSSVCVFSACSYTVWA